jgi:hypothetical protein
MIPALSLETVHLFSQKFFIYAASDTIMSPLEENQVLNSRVIDYGVDAMF